MWNPILICALTYHHTYHHTHTDTQLLNLNQPFLPGASWWSPSWLHLSAAERPAMLMNFLPELSNASRARGFFTKNNIRDGLVGRFPSKRSGYFMASQLNTWDCWSCIYWIISSSMSGWFFLWVWKLWWDHEEVLLSGSELGNGELSDQIHMIHPILGSTAGRVLPRCWGVEWFPHFPRLQIDFVGQGASIVYFGGHRHNVDQRSVKSISPHTSWLSGGGGGHRRTWLWFSNSLFSWGGFSWTNHGYVKGLYYTNYGHHLHITSINNKHWDFWLASVPVRSVKTWPFREGWGVDGEQQGFVVGEIMEDGQAPLGVGQWCWPFDECI